jgi:hypothetical protein
VPPPRTATPGSSTATSTLPSVTSRLRRLRADHLDALYDTLATTGGTDGTGRAPKTILEVHAVIRAALDHAVARGSSTATSPVTRAAVDAHPQAVSHGHGPRPSSARSSPQRVGSGSTRRCTSPPTPGCAEARSSGSSGPTSSRRPLPPVGVTHPAERRRPPRRVRTKDPHQPTQRRDRPRHPRRTSTVATTAPARRAAVRARRLDVLQHHRPVPQPRIDQPTLRPHRATQRPALASGSTTCATPTPRCSSPTAPRSRSSVRTPRPRPPRVHHAHLPAPAPRHERAAAERFATTRRHRQPVDVYRPSAAKPQVSELGPLGAGRRRR